MHFLKNAIKKPYVNGVYKRPHKSNNYYLKVGSIYSIQQEAINYRSADRALENIIRVECPEIIELDSKFSALVMPDYGDTLEVDIRNGRVPPISIPDICNLLSIFIGKGILWGGFVPRNLFYLHKQNPSFRGIDLEDFYLLTHAPEEISSLFVMKWALGWEGFLEENINAEDIYLAIEDGLKQKGIKTSHSASLMGLDEFESVFRSLLPNILEENIRGICTAKTLMSESGIFIHGEIFSFFDLGHKMEDLLYKKQTKNASYLSVIFTYCLAYIRQNFRDKELTLYHFIKKYQANEDIESIFFLLIKIITNSEFPKIKKDANVGFKNALQRAKVYEQALSICADTIKATFDIEDIDIWLRGSVASGICSICSDLDFEIRHVSNPEIDKNQLEKLLICFLEIFGIESEGTLGRPSEKDFISIDTKDTRDLHELMELRPLNDNSKLANKLHGYNLPSKWWMQKSIYEDEGVDLNGKNVFFETRALLLRYSFSSQNHIENYIPKILNIIGDTEISRKIKSNLEKALIAYETNDVLLAEYVANSNSSLSGELGFPTLKYKQKRTE